MPNSFADQIRERLENLGKGEPSLVQCEHDEGNFGNALAIFQLEELRLHFLNDRGLETVDLEVFDGHGGSVLVPLENLAVAADLLGKEELLSHYGLSDGVADASLEDDPPPGPFLNIENALGLLGEQWDQLIGACANENALQCAFEIQEVIQNRLADSFSATPVETTDEPEEGGGPAP